MLGAAWLTALPRQTSPAELEFEARLHAAAMKEVKPWCSSGWVSSDAKARSMPAAAAKRRRKAATGPAEGETLASRLAAGITSLDEELVAELEAIVAADPLAGKELLSREGRCVDGWPGGCGRLFGSVRAHMAACTPAGALPRCLKHCMLALPHLAAQAGAGGDAAVGMEGYPG